jgi:hypothetical protein
MLLLLSANWPQRALLRAQLLHDTREEVVAVDTAADALAWLVGAAFDLVVVDTQGLAPDAALLSVLEAHGQPVAVVTGPLDAARWSGYWSNLDIRAVLVRPVFIGEVSRACQVVVRHTTPARHPSG